MLRLPYQKLLIWQKAMEIAEMGYNFTRSFPKDELYALTSQIRRSASSIPANIAEGSQPGTNKDFAHFIAIAKGSLAELETHILLSQRIKYSDPKTVESFLLKTTELSKMLRSFLSSLSN